MIPYKKDLIIAVLILVMVFITWYIFISIGGQGCRISGRPSFQYEGFMMTAKSELGYQSDSSDGIKRKNRVINKIITEYDEDINRRFRSLVERKAAPTDPEMIQLVREMMDPPSTKKLKTPRKLANTPQSKEIMSILKHKKNGFFVECGGLDGQTASNTIYMNQELGWKGLIVEMDPSFYTSMLALNRKAWTLNACMSPYPYPSLMEFKESSTQLGKLVEGNSSSTENIRKTPCFPFESMMLALNVTKVDYFSLDVEGLEMEILKTINFNSINISTLSVEYEHGKANKEEYKKYMEVKGYLTHKDIRTSDPKNNVYVFDYIFVKQVSSPSL